MGRTLELFEKPKIKRRVIAHAIDHGTACDGSQIHYFVCKKCDFEEWMIATMTEGRRGIPCPNCNDALKQAKPYCKSA